MHRLLGSWLWLGLLAATAAGLGTGSSAPVCAGIIVSVESVSAGQGTSGNTLEIDVQNTGAPVDIAAFSFEVSVAVASGVSFTGADINTVANTYIFAGNSLFGPNINTSTGTTLLASDLAANGSTTLGTGSTLALGRVLFDVASTAPAGAVTVSLTSSPSTSLADPNLNNIPIDTLTNGTITITGLVVPEPASLISAVMGLLASTWLLRQFRRHPA